MPGGGGNPFPAAGAEERIRAALQGRSGEVLRLIAIQPRRGTLSGEPELLPVPRP